MPFNELRHQPSFPPFVLSITPPTPTTDKPLPALPTNEQEDSDIDTNPISFFLTAPSRDDEEFGVDDLEFLSDEYDYDDYDEDEDLSAGIEGSEEDLRNKDVREVSPSSLIRARDSKRDEARQDKEQTGEEKGEVAFGFAVPLSLKDYVSSSPKAIPNSSSPRPREASSGDGRTSRTGQHHIGALGLGLGLDIPEFKPHSFNERGRGRVRLTSNPDTRSRSLSLSPPKPRKPVSWRVPSRGIWRIDEVIEDGDGMGLSCSAPAGILRNGFGNMERRDAEAEAGKKKVVKRVHWAD